MTIPLNRLSMAAWGIALLACLFVAPSSGRAQEPARETHPERIGLRYESVLRWAPRYVLTSESQLPGPDRIYWQRIDQLPVYGRLTIEAHNLLDGRIELHLGAWGAVDGLRDSGQTAAGDVAVAYVRAAWQSCRFWAGRRFLPWGLVGGLHVDAMGVEVVTDVGIFGEAFAGRPVTPSYDSLLGPRTSFAQAELAYGMSVGYRRANRGSILMSFVDRWANGLPADRSLGLDATYSPNARVDLGANTSFDVVDRRIERANFHVSYLASSRLEVDATYSHVEPQRLLPAWSIFSVFATNNFEDLAAGATVRLRSALSLRTELALRYEHYRDGDEFQSEDRDVPSEWGYRGDLMLRWMRLSEGLGIVVHLSHRADGQHHLGFGRLAVGWSHSRGTRIAAEVATAITLDDQSERIAALGRLSTEWPVSDALDFGASVDLVRTPVVDAELRGLVMVRWRYARIEAAP